MHGGWLGKRLGMPAALLLVLAVLPAVEDGSWLLRLDRVLHQPGKWAQAQPLYLELERRAGVWQADCWGHAPTWNTAEHRGRLRMEVETADAVTLACDLEVADDPWVKGGRARLRLDLRRTEAGWTATYTGSFQTQPVHGQATLRQERGVDTVDELLGFTAEEHPRLLLRGTQLDALRAAAATREGQELLGALRASLAQPVVWHEAGADAGAHAAGHALLFALTDAADSAAQAQELVWARIRKPVGGPPLQAQAREVVGVALAYDLCYRAWLPAFRASVTAWLERQAAELVAAEAGRGKVAAHLRLNAVARAAAGIAALAIARDPGRFPEPPRQPALHRLTAPTDFTPGAGQGEDWNHDRMPQRWLAAGPFYATLDQDLLQASGGASQLNAAEDVSLTFEKETRPFRASQPAWFIQGSHTDNRGSLSLLAPIDRAYYSVTCYAAALRFGESEVVRFRLGASDAVRARIHLGQRIIRDGDLCEVAAGRYPLLIEAEIGATQAWGEIWMAPRFERVSRQEIERIKQDAAARHEEWHAAEMVWKAGGRQVLTAGDSLAAADRWLRRYLLLGLGESGWSAEGDAAQVAAAEALLPYVHARQVCSGIPVPVNAPVLPALLRGLAQRSMRLGNRVELPGFGRGDQVLTSPAVFHLGWMALAPGGGEVAAAVRRDWPGPALTGGLDPVAACFAFVQQPQFKALAPAELPGLIVDRPLGWIAQRDGGLLSCITAAGGDPSLPVVCDDAGSFRLNGLGRRWVVRGEGGPVENRVYLDKAQVQGGGRLLDIHHDDSRGLHAEFDLAGTLLDAKGQVLPGLQRRSWWTEQSLGGEVAGCWAIQDRCEVAGDPQWVLNLDSPVSVAGNSFRTGDDKATPRLVGQVLLPTHPRIEVRDRQLRIRGGAPDKKGTLQPAPAQRFLVLLSLHAKPGPVPPAEVTDLGAGVLRIRYAGRELFAGPDGFSTAAPSSP